MPMFPLSSPPIVVIAVFAVIAVRDGIGRALSHEGGTQNAGMPGILGWVSLGIGRQALWPCSGGCEGFSQCQPVRVVLEGVLLPSLSLSSFSFLFFSFYSLSSLRLLACNRLCEFAKPPGSFLLPPQRWNLSRERLSVGGYDDAGDSWGRLVTVIALSTMTMLSPVDCSSQCFQTREEPPNMADRTGPRV
ncbi:hypothetical protein F5Y07DRAFT_262641 [Xylaria sp. FL0933]|nr:hypothetical protein F5Y07DRAFT_262641 [Xylaria sp. FL0933]